MSSTSKDDALRVGDITKSHVIIVAELESFNRPGSGDTRVGAKIMLDRDGIAAIQMNDQGMGAGHVEGLPTGHLRLSVASQVYHVCTTGIVDSHVAEAAATKALVGIVSTGIRNRYRAMS